MPQGGLITIAVENTVLQTGAQVLLPAGEYVKITIRDEGVGIPAEHLSKIFDPYFTTKQGGTGLGLAIAYSIIHKHRGCITVESQLGVGTAIHIYLPAFVKGDAFNPGKAPDAPNGRILIMDDEQVMRDIISEMLHKLGYKADTAKDGTEAIELYVEAMDSGEPFDAVIMDLTVRGEMGGKETIAEIIKIDPSVIAVATSGYSNDPVMTDFKAYGFRGAIAKPYSIDQLNNLLHKLISA